MIALFGLVSLLSAFLMFSVEPMIGKMVLPDYGGTPAVWNTCLVFFQGLLLLGYFYAHALRGVLARRPLLHLGIGAAGLLTLPAALPSWASPGTERFPVVHLLAVLAVVIGLPFAALCTTAPLTQWWFSHLGHVRSGDPYFLYAAGNAGSFAGLLSYPFLVEPHLGLRAQARAWTVGYIVLVVLTGVCALVATRAGRFGLADPVPRAESVARISWPRRGRWLLLAALPSSLLLGTTSFLSTDVAAIPLLWVLPLSVYLLTFVVAFSRFGAPYVRWATFLLPGLVVSYALLARGGLGLPLRILLMCALLGAAALVAHGRLAADRPPPARLTEFYLLVSLGGALGGSFNALLAPLLFNRVVELSLAVVVLLVVLVAPTLRGWPDAVAHAFRAPTATAVWLGVAALPVLGFVVVGSLRLATASAVVGLAASIALLAVVGRAAGWTTRPLLVAAAVLVVPGMVSTTPALLRERTFYGVYRVTAANGEHLLTSGSTLHGSQSTDPVLARQPQTYYSRPGPLGDVFRAYGNTQAFNRIAVVGLGAGSIAAYGHAGQSITMYELDPAVVRIADNPRYFTYLRDTAATTRMVVGDGRLRIAVAPPKAYGLIALDAFSSDSIPVHLMTREAVELYLSKLRDDGLLLFHVTNHYLNLDRVLSGIAADEHLTGLIRRDGITDPVTYRVHSVWVALARSPATLAALRAIPGWVPLAPGGRAWTDGYSNLVSVWR